MPQRYNSKEPKGLDRMSERDRVGDQVGVTGRAQVMQGLVGYRKKFGYFSRYNGKLPKDFKKAAMGSYPM